LGERKLMLINCSLKAAAYCWNRSEREKKRKVALPHLMIAMLYSIASISSDSSMSSPAIALLGKREYLTLFRVHNHMNFRALYQTTYRKKGSRIRISTKEAVTSTGIGRVPLLRHAAI
jgi:hypothetical protein